MGVKVILGALATAGLVGAMSMATALPAEAQQTQSRLFEVTKSKKLRVCQFPLYYSISFRNPKTGKIEGIDADLAEDATLATSAEIERIAALCSTQAGAEDGLLESCARRVSFDCASDWCSRLKCTSCISSSFLNGLVMKRAPSASASRLISSVP